MSNVLATLCFVHMRHLADGKLLDSDELLAAAASVGLVARRDDLPGLAQSAIDIFNQLNKEQRKSIVIDRANRQVFSDERSRSPFVVDEENGMLVSKGGVLFVRTL